MLLFYNTIGGLHNFRDRLNPFLRYLLAPVYKPVQTLFALLEDMHKIRRATLIFLLLGVLYTLSVQLAYARGYGASVQPFLTIPAADYYAWQRFFQIPLFFVTTILFAGVVRLLSSAAGGRGSFESLYAVLCVTQTLPMLLTMWIPETVNFIFFPLQKIYPDWLDIARQVVGIAWPLVLAAVGVRIIEKIKWRWCVLFTVIASFHMIGLMLVFIR